MFIDIFKIILELVLTTALVLTKMENEVKDIIFIFIFIF